MNSAHYLTAPGRMALNAASEPFYAYLSPIRTASEGDAGGRLDAVSQASLCLGVSKSCHRRGAKADVSR